MKPEWRAPACYVGVAIICLCYIAIVPGVRLTDIIAGAGLGAAAMWALIDWETVSQPAKARERQNSARVRWQRPATAQPDTPREVARWQPQPRQDIYGDEFLGDDRPAPMPRRAPRRDPEREAPVRLELTRRPAESPEPRPAKAKAEMSREDALRVDTAKLEALRKEVARQELAIHREALRRPAAAEPPRNLRISDKPDNTLPETTPDGRPRRPFH